MSVFTDTELISPEAAQSCFLLYFNQTPVFYLSHGCRERVLSQWTERVLPAGRPNMFLKQKLQEREGRWRGWQESVRKCAKQGRRKTRVFGGMVLQLFQLKCLLSVLWMSERDAGVTYFSLFMLCLIIEFEPQLQLKYWRVRRSSSCPNTSRQDFTRFSYNKILCVKYQLYSPKRDLYSPLTLIYTNIKSDKVCVNTVYIFLPDWDAQCLE